MVKIISDSTCDLTREILEQYDITLTPLYITTDSREEFRDGLDIKPADVFRMVEDEKKICKTAAVNVFDYEKIFAEYSPKYDAVIHINISQGFSACNQNANIAAEDFANVYVVNSKNLSSASGYLVHDAGIMAKEGKCAQEILDHLEKAAPNMNASFIIDKLDYLHKGGRCSGVALLASKALSLKPCIEVHDGAMRVGTKYRGKFESVLGKYVKDRLNALAEQDNLDLKRIYITHTTCSPEIVRQVREDIQKYAKFAEIIETQAGCTISNHCGPNTLGILFKQKIQYE
jgi:DegV family protein with EDD domain